MSDKRKEFYKLNSEYQKCLNEYYDKFLEGKDVSSIENVCQEKLEQMKQTGDFYKNMQKEFENYQKEQAKEKK